jgi:hypothetical protein
MHCAKGHVGEWSWGSTTSACYWMEVSGRDRAPVPLTRDTHCTWSWIEPGVGPSANSSQFIRFIVGKKLKTVRGPRLERCLCLHADNSMSALVSPNKQTPWSESARVLYLPSNRRLSAKLVLTFVDRGYHVVSLTDPYGSILGFLDRSRYFSIK